MKPQIPKTHKILDHTKIKGYTECPRKFFYEHICGWSQERDEHDLIYGQAVHMAFEHMYDRQKDRGDERLQTRDADEGWLIFLEYYRQFYPPETDPEKAPKDPSNTDNMLQGYVNLYGPFDRFEVIHSEISGAVPINVDGRLIYFRLDAVVKDLRSNTYMVLEHKTSKWSQILWEASLALSLQGGIGVHVLSCLYPANQVKGLTYNGVFLYKKGNEFRRVPYNRSDAAMQDWLVTMNHYVRCIEDDTTLLQEADSENNPVMYSFAKNPSSCVMYNRPCPYMDFCKAWVNPCQHIKENPPDGFRSKYWDPRDMDKEWTSKSAKVLNPEELTKE